MRQAAPAASERPAQAANNVRRIRFMMAEHSIDSGGMEAVQMAVMQVPNSSGTAAPKLATPPNACDCHMHIYDGARYPPDPARQRGRTPTRASPTTGCCRSGSAPRRTVVVQPAAYAHRQRGSRSTRVAQLGTDGARRRRGRIPTVTDAELKRIERTAASAASASPSTIRRRRPRRAR